MRLPTFKLEFEKPLIVRAHSCAPQPIAIPLDKLTDRPNPLGVTDVRPFTATFSTDRFGFTIAVSECTAVHPYRCISYVRSHGLTFLGTLINVAVQSIL